MKLWTLVIVLLLVAACLVWIAIVQMPDGKLHAFFLDVESGQALLVRTPSGRIVVIDGGPQPNALLTALGRYLPFWQRNVYAVIATHQGRSAILPLFDVCQRYQVGNVLAPPAGEHPTATYLQWRALLAQRRLSLNEAQAGALFDLGGPLIEVIAVSDGQLALRLSYGETSVLLPGMDGASATSPTASVVAFPAASNLAAKLTPASTVEAVIVFSGKQGDSAAQAPEWPGVSVFSTAVHGSLEMVSDGHHIAIRPVR